MNNNYEYLIWAIEEQGRALKNIFKRFFLSMFVFLNISSYAQVVTNFYGQDKIVSKNETAALYTVAIHDNYTAVTVQLIPTKNRSRMNFWTSKNTYIIAGEDIVLPIVGFSTSTRDVDTRPFFGNWGWNNVTKGNPYYYTMIFAGKIPPGVTNFTLIDKGNYNGEHGYGFTNYTLNNPRTESTYWSEYSIKQNVDSNNDGICGIYESADDIGYKLGCVKLNGEYQLIYLYSKKSMSWWQNGDIKAVLRPSATTGVFKAEWFMADKTSNNDCYIIFDGASMKTIIGKDETFYLKMYPTNSSSGGGTADTDKWSGTGFALNNGYIATNYHVVENAKSIKVQGIRGLFDTEYNATVVSTDKLNDLAVIKINDSRFKGFGTIPYRVKTSISEVGENVFVLGYPLTTTMGDEIKLTTGVISSKTGFRGDISLYQISAPVQPGNSGGPLFDGNGNLIGIVNAKHSGAENVSYAIKTSYLSSLAKNVSITSILPNKNLVSGLSLSNKVKSLKNFVFMIKCSSSIYSENSISSSNTVNYPLVESISTKLEMEGLRIKCVKMEHDYTAIEFICHSQIIGNRYYQLYQSHKNICIMVNGIRYIMTRVEGIKMASDNTYFSHAGQNTTFTLYFPPISTNATSIDLINPVNSELNFYGIKIR